LSRNNAGTIVQQGVSVTYRELHGRLDPDTLSAAGATTAAPGDAVVLSNFERGSAESRGAHGLCIRYVARGSENYRIAGRGFRVEAGQVMIAPHDGGANCEIRAVERAGTLGMCTLVRGSFDWLFGPVILAGGCTAIGPLVRQSAQTLWRGGGRKDELAASLVVGLRAELPAVINSLLAQAAAVDAAKPSTRFEMVRRANLAQAYLHSTVDRQVDLDELAQAVGASPFRLLKGFQQCFGETPATYHRRLRLTLALEAARQRDLPISAVADDFGFAGASAFSHAHRRAFGHAPVWRKRVA
jgi:AraC-like DNA-binding protein